MGEEYPSKADAYDIFSEIGTGAFARVYHARVKGKSENLAVKILDLDELNVNWEEIRKEIQTMRLLDHPNVVRIYTAFVDQADLWIVMPLLAGGSCASVLKELFPTGLKDEALIATILRETLQGLEYLHKDGRIHRDIKAGNILLSEKGDVKIADFGVAGALTDDGSRKNHRVTFVGTPCWMAPEVMEQTSGYDYKADIWSFGITAMELAFGRAPYAKHAPMKVLLLTLQEDPPTIEIYKDDTYKFGRSFRDLIARCLQKDPAERPTATDLLKHKFIKKAKEGTSAIEQALVSRLPPRSVPKQVLDLRKIRAEQRMGLEGDNKRKPISGQAWVFDSNDIAAVKRGEKKDIDPSRAPAAYANKSDDKKGDKKVVEQIDRFTISDD